MTNNKLIPFALLILLITFSSCGSPANNSPVEPIITPTPTPTGDGNADVLFVRAVQDNDQSWTFHVTVSHPDTGWTDYADGWDVVLPDGTVLKPDPGSPFTRFLTHPHEEEQPFTRSQGGVQIPPNVTFVTVRAHDMVDGFGGQEVTVDLTLDSGPGFEIERASEPASVLRLGLTHQRLDGNRFAAGSLEMINSEPVRLDLLGTPEWVAGVATGPDSLAYLVVFDDGKMQHFEIVSGEIAMHSLSVVLPSGMPPALKFDGEIANLSLSGPDQSPNSHPIVIPSGKLVYINNSGDIILQDDEKVQTLFSGALQDGRLLSDGQGRLIFYSAPTTLYDHGVLGDGIEGGAITVLGEDGEIVITIPAPNGSVYEGLAPILADLDEDGEPEIIATLSNAQDGARLVAYNMDGSLFARSRAIGTGYRWRNQLAAGPFGPNGEIEIVDVLTPHLGGVVEFFRIDGEDLVLTAEVRGFTSHVIGSRNLDMALAADLDADGRLDVLVPSQSREMLGVIQRTVDGAVVLAEIPLSGKLSTNLSAVELPDGSLSIAAGLDNNTLLIWLP